MRLISWNVQWGRSAHGDVNLSRTIDEARRLADFDVLCMQEITRGFSVLAGHPGDDQFAELADLLPGYTVLGAIGADLAPLKLDAPAAPRRQFGNALATRLPVERVIRHSLPWPADPESPSMQRVALEAVLRAPGGSVRVIVTHLEFYSLRQRLAQVERLRELQREAAGHALNPAPAENPIGPFADTARPVSAIVCGDFNSAYLSEAYRRMLEPIEGSPSFVDAWTALHPGGVPPMTAGVFDKVQWADGPLTCDFVFVTDDLVSRLLSCEVDCDTRASDHQPVVIEIG